MMRNLLILTIILLSFKAVSQQQAKVDPATGDPHLPVLTEVLVGIPNLKPALFNSVKESLKGIKGVEWAGYCEDQFVVFLLVNRAIQPDNKLITDVLLDINKGFTIYFMRNSFKEELDNCRDKEKAMTR